MGFPRFSFWWAEVQEFCLDLKTVNQVFCLPTCALVTFPFSDKMLDKQLQKGRVDVGSQFCQSWPQELEAAAYTTSGLGEVNAGAPLTSSFLVKPGPQPMACHHPHLGRASLPLLSQSRNFLSAS